MLKIKLIISVAFIIIGLNSCSESPTVKPIIKIADIALPMDTTSGTIWYYGNSQNGQLKIQGYGRSLEKWVMQYDDTMQKIELLSYIYYVKEYINGFPEITKIAIAEYEGVYIFGIAKFDLTASGIPLLFYIKLFDFDKDFGTAKDRYYDETRIGTEYIYECKTTGGDRIMADSSWYNSQKVDVTASMKGFYNGNLGMDFIILPKFGFYKFWNYYFTGIQKP